MRGKQSHAGFPSFKDQVRWSYLAAWVSVSLQRSQLKHRTCKEKGFEDLGIPYNAVSLGIRICQWQWPDRPMTLQAQEYPISLRSPGLQTWCLASTSSEFCPFAAMSVRHKGPTAMQNRGSVGGNIQYTSFKYCQIMSKNNAQACRFYVCINGLLPLGHAISAALILKERGISPTLDASRAQGLRLNYKANLYNATTAWGSPRGLRNSEWSGSAKVALVDWFDFIWFLSYIRITRMQPEHSQYINMWSKKTPGLLQHRTI